MIYRIPAEEVSLLMPLAEETTVAYSRVICMMHVVIVQVIHALKRDVMNKQTDLCSAQWQLSLIIFE